MHPTPRPNRVLRTLPRTLLLLAWASPALAGELPEATLHVRGKSLILQVTPPAGEHINEEAPARYQVGTMELAGPGVLADARLPWSPAPEARTVALELPLCQTSSDQTRAQCRMVSLTTTLAPGELRGKVRLTATPPPTPLHPNDFGAVVQIYDFSAVWCPPCNQMKVEVLEDPTNAADLAGLQITVVDVDRPESWPLKSRYTVGGYPTLVAVDAQGQERSRFLGYPNEAALLAWLGGLREAEPMERVRRGPSRIVPRKRQRAPPFSSQKPARKRRRCVGWRPPRPEPCPSTMPAYCWILAPKTWRRWSREPHPVPGSCPPWRPRPHVGPP